LAIKVQLCGCWADRAVDRCPLNTGEEVLAVRDRLRPLHVLAFVSQSVGDEGSAGLSGDLQVLEHIGRGHLTERIGKGVLILEGGACHPPSVIDPVGVDGDDGEVGQLDDRRLHHWRTVRAGRRKGVLGEDG